MACYVEGGRSFQAVCAKAFRACLAPIFLACNMARLKAAWQQHSTDALLRLSPPTAHFAVKLFVAHLFSG